MGNYWLPLQQRLVTVLPTLSGWSGVTVYDSMPTTAAAPAVYCTVGYLSDEHEGLYKTTFAPDGVRYMEQGSVSCHLVARTGSVDIPSMRATVFALADTFETYWRGDRKLGVLPPDSEIGLTVDVMLTADENGTAAALAFTLDYTAIT